MNTQKNNSKNLKISNKKNDSIKKTNTQSTMNTCKANMPQTDASELDQLVSDKNMAVTRSMANSKEQGLSQLICKENIG